MMVASGCVWRCSMNAPISRIGPITFVAIVDSALATKDSGLFQSSIFIIPAIVTRTLRSGCLSRISRALTSTLFWEVVAQEHWCSSGFGNTDLDLQLKKRGIHQLIVIGQKAN